ncbi:MAG: hypothetical protein DKM50_03780 [Candidatus Margulisiibacteriota bacterium]|nr:MAG: hypothetical protein A2X43_01495 [Candidatus Margulisbacteria bacterium GWD2_39_127]OGI04539.1 MAG: hypothetical protein A2X42_10450 [Candidatus Margulisbacteria bacterium GWF2_38_17]PZM82256.1 MAG: hypothetical protein DKM50_03780 [Candidatus Margulisiibacteriota bacterium]HAR62998.1 hypothetical protein [Candidatus Margulisiibacteriota bacterium]HCY36965.1 hypothetical protein [Candidatus Margulisiibacteriota bacterium]
MDRKTFFIIAFVLMLVMASLGYSETRTYQKVTRKAVEVVPKQGTAIRPAPEIKDLDTEAAPAKPPVQEAAKPASPTTEEQIGQQQPAATALSTKVPVFQVDVRLGSIAPGFGVISDASFLPIAISNTAYLTTRAGLGFALDNDDSALVLYVNELLNFKMENSPFTFYTGAGINSPLKSDSKLGYNLVLGAEYPTKLSEGFRNEALFLETGINNFAVGDNNKNVFNILLGYKFTF